MSTGEAGKGTLQKLRHLRGCMVFLLPQNNLPQHISRRDKSLHLCPAFKSLSSGLSLSGEPLSSLFLPILSCSRIQKSPHSLIYFSASSCSTFLKTYPFQDAGLYPPAPRTVVFGWLIAVFLLQELPHRGPKAVPFPGKAQMQ